jgi:DNA-binding XRE family transcriptional regulator
VADMNKKELSWEEVEAKLLENPEVVKESEKLEPEFQALRKLILLRRRNKITQQDLAEKINMRQSHIARLESGEITPTLKILKRYADGLNLVITFNIISLEEYTKENMHIKTLPGPHAPVPDSVDIRTA